MTSNAAGANREAPAPSRRLSARGNLLYGSGAAAATSTGIHLTRL